MLDLKAAMPVAIAVLVVLFVPGLVWATMIAWLYAMIREQVAKLRVTTIPRLTPIHEVAEESR